MVSRSVNGSIKVLDCTFRDGGYYTNWIFDRDIANTYFLAMQRAKVDVVEVGFRFLNPSGFKGPYAYTTDEFLNTLDLPDGTAIAVMVNASDIVTYEDGPVAGIGRLFKPRSDSQVDLVRIACHLREFEEALKGAERLKHLGYEVGFNLMQAGNRAPAELTQAASSAQETGVVDVLYFADSLGNMNSAKVSETIQYFKEGWTGPIGIHAHDNKGLALSNVLSSISDGATWLDATILGMGRGAGNLKTEQLLLELKQNDLGAYNPEAVFPLVMEQFQQLQDTYKWGPCLPYYLSAVYEIHPTYVQEMLSRPNFESHELLAGLEYLAEGQAQSYQPRHLATAIQGLPSKDSSVKESHPISNWCQGAEVVICGSGASLTEHCEDLQRLIAARGMKTVMINTETALGANVIDYYVACHPSRIALECDGYAGLSKPVVMPTNVIGDKIRERSAGACIIPYWLSIDVDTFSSGEEGCSLPGVLALGYAISFALAGGAERIFLAGIDGYKPGDDRHAELKRLFALVRTSYPDLRISAITPTRLNILQESLFNPDL